MSLRVGRNGVPWVGSEGFSLTALAGIFTVPGSCPFAKRKSQTGMNGGKEAFEVLPSSAPCRLASGNSQGSLSYQPPGSPGRVCVWDGRRRCGEGRGRAALGGASGSGRAGAEVWAGDGLSRASAGLGFGAVWPLSAHVSHAMRRLVRELLHVSFSGSNACAQRNRGSATSWQLTTRERSWWPELHNRSDLPTRVPQFSYLMQMHTGVYRSIHSTCR